MNWFVQCVLSYWNINRLNIYTQNLRNNRSSRLKLKKCLFFSSSSSSSYPVKSWSLFHQNGRKTSYIASWDYIIDWILFIVKICIFDQCESDRDWRRKKAFSIFFLNRNRYRISSALILNSSTCDVAIYALHFRLPFIFQMSVPFRAAHGESKNQEWNTRKNFDEGVSHSHSENEYTDKQQWNQKANTGVRSCEPVII